MNAVQNPSPSLGWPIVLDRIGLVIRKKTILENITLELTAKDGTTAILGGNGAGKSQFLRVLNGLVAPTSGTIRWAGETSHQHIRQKHLLISTQQPPFRRTVIDNLLLSLTLCGFSKAEAITKATDALAACSLYAQKRTPARQLSQGQKQLLLLAGAWAIAPNTLLLDEPTSHLDPPNTQKTEEIIAEISARGTQIIMVSHDIHQAKRLAGRIVFLDRGRVCADQPAEAFFTAPKHPIAEQYIQTLS